MGQRPRLIPIGNIFLRGGNYITNRVCMDIFKAYVCTKGIPLEKRHALWREKFL